MVESLEGERKELVVESLRSLLKEEYLRKSLLNKEKSRPHFAEP